MTTAANRWPQGRPYSVSISHCYNHKLVAVATCRRAMSSLELNRGLGKLWFEYMWIEFWKPHLLLQVKIQFHSASINLNRKFAGSFKLLQKFAPFHMDFRHGFRNERSDLAAVLTWISPISMGLIRIFKWMGREMQDFRIKICLHIPRDSDTEHD